MRMLLSRSSSVTDFKPLKIEFVGSPADVAVSIIRRSFIRVALKTVHPYRLSQKDVISA